MLCLQIFIEYLPVQVAIKNRHPSFIHRKMEAVRKVDKQLEYQAKIGVFHNTLVFKLSEDQLHKCVLGSQKYRLSDLLNDSLHLNKISRRCVYSFKLEVREHGHSEVLQNFKGLCLQLGVGGTQETVLNNNNI